MKELVFLNGNFITPDQAKTSVLEPGFLYGWGLFETMRSNQGRIVYFDEHLQRLLASCRLLKIRCAYSAHGLKKNIQQTVGINGLSDARVRLSVVKTKRGSDTLVAAQRYKPYSEAKYKRGFNCCISAFKQQENSFLAGLKTTNYLFYQLSYLAAQELGFDEALILNNRGYLAEASHSNIFLVKENELFTPALACACLAGITRQAVLDLAKKYKIKVYEGNFSLQDLYSADEAFLTNSLMGVMPLTSLQNKCLGNKADKLTQFLRQKYNQLLYGI